MVAFAVSVGVVGDVNGVGVNMVVHGVRVGGIYFGGVVVVYGVG